MSDPRELPILFSGDMVRATLADRKTVTRRVMKPQPILEQGVWRWQPRGRDINLEHVNASMSPCGPVGTRLWVRETWRVTGRVRGMQWEGCLEYRADHSHVPLTPDNFGQAAKMWNINKPLVWRPSIHMPRWASRLTLENTGVSVQRVQEINGQGHHDDVLKEGWPFKGIDAGGGPVKDFRILWDAINAKPKPSMHNPWGVREKCQVAYPWDAVSAVTTVRRKASPWYGCKVYLVGNPFVWVVPFRRKET